MSLFKKNYHKHSGKSRTYRNPNYRIITFEDPLSPSSEAFRRIKIGLEFSRSGNVGQVVQMCSAVRGEGKTTTCLNIAATYVEDGKRAIIIDLDLRCPRIHRAFGVENKNGIVDYLVGKIDLENAVKHGKNGIDFINRGMSVAYPTAALGSPQLVSLIDELKERYDVVLIDCPPVLMVSDACIIAKLCDGAVFVISSRVTEKNAAKEAVNILKQNQVNIFGSVLTEVSAKNGSNYYYYSSYYSHNG